MFATKGLHHVGIVVQDIEFSMAWYRDMFDLPSATVNHGEGDLLDLATGLDGAELSFAMVDIGSTRIEFLQYHAPEGAPFDLRNCDTGASHLCFQVDDADVAYAELSAKGAVFAGPPTVLEGGPFAGSKWAYFRDPDGIQLEIWQG